MLKVAHPFAALIAFTVFVVSETGLFSSPLPFCAQITTFDFATIAALEVFTGIPDIGIAAAIKSGRRAASSQAPPPPIEIPVT